MIQNRYLIVQLIGKGGMGEVYLAVDQRLGSAVALKRTFFHDDKTLGSAFEREARILGRLRHPVLPKVIDHFAENNDQFLVMEHISGDDLSKRLELANKPFPLSWVMFWADQMLDALNYLHSHEPPIIHRDIKPQNLKLTDENHIVLLDFGLSKDFDSNSASNPLNSASVAGYSPHFASMEQIRGTGTDARSDLYSLSATLYQLMTNTVPSDALTRADALLGGAKDPIVPLNELNPEIPVAVSDVILKGVSVRQDERFATATEMQKALRRAFNKGEAPSDVKTDLAKDETAASPVPTTQPQYPESSEMVTRTHSDIGETDFEATLQMDAVPGIEEFKPSDVKTEILSTPDLAAQTEISETPTEVVEAPVMAAAVAAAGSVATAAAQTPVPPKTASRQKPAKSSSKTGLIIGGLIGLLGLAAVAGGGGWYAYKNYYAVAKPTPTPTAAPSVVPSPSATVLAEANKDTNSYTITEEVDNSNTANNNSNRAVVTTQTPGTVAPRSAPPVATKDVPVRTSKPPAAKSTPKTKAKDDRTVILQ